MVQRVLVIVFKVLVCLILWRLTGSPRRAVFGWIMCNMLGPVRLWKIVCIVTRTVLWFIDESYGSAAVITVAWILQELGLADWGAVLRWMRRSLSAKMDITGDGHFDHEDMAELVVCAASKAKRGLDANGDGKLDLQDLKDWWTYATRGRADVHEVPTCSSDLAADPGKATKSE